jgi:hypothetical protein
VDAADAVDDSLHLEVEIREREMDSTQEGVDMVLL